MSSRYQNILPLSQAILNIFLIFASLSIILYLMGFLFEVSYYDILGINDKFLDFQQHEYILSGLMLLISIFPILFVYFIFYYYFGSLKKEIIYKRTLKFLFISFLIFLILILICFWLKQMRTAFLLVNFDMQVFLLGIFIYCLNRTKKVMSIQLILLAIFFTVFVLPMIEGYLGAKSRLITNNFDLYTISLNREKVINEAKFVYFGKASYFFFINEKLTIIPQSEIILLEKN